MDSTALALIRSNHHGRGGDVPWQVVVGYIAIGLIGWVITATLFLRHEQAKSSKTVDSDAKVMAVLMGMTAAIGWPLAVVGFGIWKIVERFISDPVAMTKRDR
ncbi:hypothetical protein [Streptomyces ziwulingensis]|uniref:Integral membrane protein n=1 Tax=Streptomyces ziwulingensis TaxID=1045501 RepID=A0ABP9D2H9_9ACTN